MHIVRRGIPATSLLLAFELLAHSTLSAQIIAQNSVPPNPTGPAGTYWRLQQSNQPPLPYNPFPDLPVHTLDPTNHVYLIDDSTIDYPALNASRLNASQFSRMSSFLLDPGEAGSGREEVGGAASFSGGGVFTNAPETLLFDTLGSSSNGVLPSWRDTRPSPAPDGMALGILIATNCPFELTRIQAEVVFENPESLPDTEIEVGFFRGTNQFQYGLYLDPEYTVSDVEGTLTKTLTDMGDGHWLLSVDLPTYAWGTNRVLTIRTVPNSSGPMAKMSLIAGSETVPGVTVYSSDNTTTNMVQVPLPKMQVWRRMLSDRRSVSYEASFTDLDLTMLPGYQLGSSTNLLSPWAWETDEQHNWRSTVDTREGSGFFVMRPDPSE